MNLTPISRKYHGGLHLSFIHWCNLFTKLLHKLVNYKYGNKVCHKVCRKIITRNIGLSLPGLSLIFHNIQYHLCTTPTHNLFRFITILMLHIKYYIVLMSLHAFLQNAKINENTTIISGFKGWKINTFLTTNRYFNFQRVANLELFGFFDN